MEPWIYKNKPVESIDDLPEGTIGFVYLIENLTNGKFYIGKKSIYSTTKKHFGKKKLAQITDKRLKTYEYVTKENTWKSYKGSNKPLLKDIKDGHVIKRVIIDAVKSKKELTYYENKRLYCYGVIEPLDGEKFYNDNIQGKFFRKLFEGE